MRFRLIFTRRATRDLEGLDPEVRRRIRTTMERYREEPLRYARPMVNSELGDYRFRIGGYRVIFDLMDDEIVVLRVGHRREIYR